MENLLNNLKNFDAYPKTMEDFRVRTYSGAAGKCFAHLQEMLANVTVIDVFNNHMRHMW